ncbi:MAG: short-chain dehydrogenase/reductase [Alphaproteobacteria bacterium]|nr:short-chain dehydrogenase/reductase [Alphaproteobacteria bacterium]
MELGIAGRWALVTGASRGIGRAIAKTLGAEGCNLHLAARSAEGLASAAEEITAAGGVEVAIHPLDLSQPEAVAALGEACAEVDILVNNAGDIPAGTLEGIDSATWRRCWDLKVYGYVDLTRAILPRMQARKSGVVVNVIGAAGEAPNPNYVAGCMGNAALMMFTRCLGGDSIGHGVRVVGVNPGATMSDRHLAHVRARAERVLGDAERWPELETRLPSGRSTRVEEIADTVAFLASDRASHITGTTLRVDGGVHSHYWR